MEEREGEAPAPSQPFTPKSHQSPLRPQERMVRLRVGVDWPRTTGPGMVKAMAFL